MIADEPGYAARSALVVEDDGNIAYVVSAALRLSGLSVTSTSSGSEAVQLLQGGELPDLVVLDIMLPDLDGFEVCRKLRLSHITVPVLFLTARQAVDDRVLGLSVGGDDYLVKPFSIDELMARVRAILRRTGRTVAPPPLTCGDVVLDDGAHVVIKGGEPVNLSPTEYRLLRFLLWNRGRIVSRKELLDEVWGYDVDAETTAVETFMSSLRKKVDSGPSRMIHTVRGFGYRMGDAR